jgi:HEAT repeat protein
MAASYLSVVQDPSVVSILMQALDDDHWWVRSQAALGLGRMRAREAKEKLAHMATEDWDQTVRSRCREALERIE